MLKFSQLVSNKRLFDKRFIWLSMILLNCCLTPLAYSGSNIPDITDQQLSADYWQTKIKKNEGMSMKNQDVELFNQQLLTSNPHVVDPLASPENLDKAELLSKINKISRAPSSARFYKDGTMLTQQHFNKYAENLNFQAIKDKNTIQFGLVTKRSALRTFPTLDRVFNRAMDFDLDRFQETAVFPAEAVTILHSSLDGKWFLVQNYNYLAWMQQSDVAIGSKAQILEYLAHPNFLLITGDKVLTSFVPELPEISEVQVDMGVKLPLLNNQEQRSEIYGQSAAGNFQVKLPTRNSDGSLSIKTALIGRTQDVHIGYLDYTAENIIAQGFKFLGERYGWGHDYNGRDCTGFVGEIYKTFGVLMPRNSGQQGKGQYGTNFRFDKNSDSASKLATIEKLQIGDLIYIPGHVMMYLGDENGQPRVIHDVKGLAYWTPEGEFYKGVLNAVSVTPLIKLQLNKTTSYVDKIYNIKRITLDNIQQ